MVSKFYKDGTYVPDFIPDEDVKAFSRFPKPKEGFGDNPAIVIVDMTHAFVDDKYALGFSKTGIPCVKAIKELLDGARPLKISIFYTRTDMRSRAIDSIADPTSNASKLFRELDPLSNVIMEEIAPQEGEIVIEKIGPSGFFGTPFVTLLNKVRADTLIITGMVTSGCIRATAVDAFAYRYRTIIPIECVADRSQISHQVSLFDLSMKYAHVMPLSDVMGNLRKIKRKKTIKVSQ